MTLHASSSLAQNALPAKFVLGRTVSIFSRSSKRDVLFRAEADTALNRLQRDCRISLSSKRSALLKTRIVGLSEISSSSRIFSTADI